MLEPLFGSVNKEKVLIFLYSREEGYPNQISRFFKTSLDPIQKQLEKLEDGGILYSRMAGRTRMYAFNPRYAFLKELKALLEKALVFYPANKREALLMVRRRPRRREKSL